MFCQQSPHVGKHWLMESYGQNCINLPVIISVTAVFPAILPWPAVRGRKWGGGGDHSQGLPWWLSGKESACQCIRHEFDPWSRKIPCATKQLSPRAPATEPERHSHWVHVLQLWKPMPRRPQAPQEKPQQWEVLALQWRAVPCFLKLKKSLHSNEHPHSQK